MVIQLLLKGFFPLPFKDDKHRILARKKAMLRILFHVFKEDQVFSVSFFYWTEFVLNQNKLWDTLQLITNSQAKKNFCTSVFFRFFFFGHLIFAVSLLSENNMTTKSVGWSWLRKVRLHIVHIQCNPLISTSAGKIFLVNIRKFWYIKIMEK